MEGNFHVVELNEYAAASDVSDQAAGEKISCLSKMQIEFVIASVLSRMQVEGGAEFGFTDWPVRG